MRCATLASPATRSCFRTAAPSRHGLLDERTAQLAVLRRLSKERDTDHGSFIGGVVAGALGHYIAPGGGRGIDLESKRVRDMLTSVGLTTDEVKRAGGLAGMMSQVASQRNAQMGRAEFAGIASALAVDIAPLIGLSQDQLGEQRTMNQLFGMVQRQLAAHGSVFDPDFLKSVLVTLKDNAVLQAKPGNTYIGNVNIEMSAKDPDRWMAEFDAKIQRRVRAPSQAKGAIHTVGGM